ncbi:Detected protein of confused Function [Hibiscus syriacus]|uniref:Detected protein of confused Function n=1 Tax=Hibiscus syriacus TaxID=106335 RepID=A0A6A3ABG4_HIBSY|nr:Detected protein of confused Function [Hibiscus syriacus]
MAGWSMRAAGASTQDCAKSLEKLEPFFRRNGGYDVVSESGLWGSVAKESGLDLNVASSFKLAYWSVDGVGAELKEFLLESKKKAMEYSQVEANIVAGADGGEKCVKGEQSIHIDLTKRVLCYEEVENLRNVDDLKNMVFGSECGKRFILVDYGEDMPSNMAKSVVNSICNDDEDCVEFKKCTDNDDDDVMILDSNDIKQNLSSHKRKRDSTWEMLHWISEVAKDPCHLVVGSLPESSKWKAYGSEELWKQVLLFREAAFLKNDNHSSAGQSNLQKNQKMHPHMYGDNSKLGYNLRERLSCTRNVFFGKRVAKGQDQSQSCSLGNHSDSDSSMIGIDKQLHGICDSATPGSVFNYDVGIQVPIGPLFQVEVPEWKGVVSESDAKWLGTRVWPLEKTEKRSFVELDRIGKGRPDSCGCHNQESIQCVKFHVRERRLKVKLELGSAFNKWKFDKMGEDVAFAWAEEQQKMFSSIVKSNPPSLEKSFWDDIYKYFPKKSRESSFAITTMSFSCSVEHTRTGSLQATLTAMTRNPKTKNQLLKGGNRSHLHLRFQSMDAGEVFLGSSFSGF